MYKFIEVTENGSGNQKTLINIDHIIRVSPENNGSMIWITETGNVFGVNITENYADVKILIHDAQ
jgi:hypothetical protein